MADPFEHNQLTVLTAEQQTIKAKFQSYLDQLPAWELGNVPSVYKYTHEKRFTAESDAYFQKLDKLRNGVDIKEHIKKEKNIPFDDITPPKK